MKPLPTIIAVFLVLIITGYFVARAKVVDLEKELETYKNNSDRRNGMMWYADTSNREGFSVYVTSIGEDSIYNDGFNPDAYYISFSQSYGSEFEIILCVKSWDGVHYSTSPLRFNSKMAALSLASTFKSYADCVRFNQRVKELNVKITDTSLVHCDDYGYIKIYKLID